MAELTFGRDLSLPRLRVQAIEWVMAHREIVALVSIMAIAAVLRFWGLDAKALHHDESLHAQYTWYLYNGPGYTHDPLMHGPFLFHSGAAVFFLFGASDFTARILPALFGTALVGMPFFLRKQIGWKAVLIAAVLIAISPTLLYISRFYRDDIYIDVWMFAMVICTWCYLDEQKPLYLVIFAAALSLSFASMEITFILAAIMLVFFDLMLAFELGKGEGKAGGVNPGGRMFLAGMYLLPAFVIGVRAAFGQGPTESMPTLALMAMLPLVGSIALLWSPGLTKDSKGATDTLVKSLALAPFAWLIAVGWPLLGKRPFSQDRLPPIGDVLVILGTLTLPQFAAAVQQIPLHAFKDQGYNAPAEHDLRNLTVFSLLLASTYAGLLWRPKLWLIAAAAFYIPYVLLFTTFFTNMGGFFSGIWGSLDYWLAQQEVQRGGQPVYYYALMTPLYEFLPLLVAIGAGVWMTLRGDSLKRWMVFWLIGIFVGLSYAGEKMPWLEVHIALPLVLVAAIGMARLSDVLQFSDKRWQTAAITAGAAALGVLLMVEMSGAGKLLGLLIVSGLIGWALAQLVTGQRQAGARTAATIVLAGLFLLTLRASLTLSFKNPDVPVEMAVYTQSSREIPQLTARIDALARESGMGHNLPIVVDSNEGYTWPWAWYLRDYHQVAYIDLTQPNYQPPDGAVMLVSRFNVPNIDDSGYSATPYKHRWWLLEEPYRNLTVSKAVDILTHGDSLKSLAHYFLYRGDPKKITGSTDAVAYFPDSLSAFDVDQAPPEPPLPPQVLADGRIVIGDTGSGPGKMQQPTGLFVDSQGNLWLADSRNNRIQKFDAQGNYVARINRSSGTSLNEPWSVAVDAEGFVYVADTWNHRILKFTPELQFLMSWGTPSVRQDPGPLELFGPRDILLDPDGSLWVTDTGNKRLIHYSNQGQPLGVFGQGGAALGQFAEPVGIAHDTQGRFYIADTWNARVQIFTPDFGSVASFNATWASQDVLAKPYIDVLSDGRIIVTDPARGVLLLYDANGNAVGSWRPSPTAMPIGVTAMPQGGFAFSDARTNQVEIVPHELIGSLFK